MKNIIISFSILTLFLAMGTKPVQAQQASVSFQIFYDQLAPYGEWVNDPDYGYLWLPEVDQNFQPYATNGYWVNTQYGNTWYSNYDWGWAPFHYGRWIYTDYYGWAWIPGYEWGPAWVSWRQGGGQYGWAPLGPGMNFSVNINIPLRYWVFVPQRYFFNNNIYRYYTPYRNYSNFYNRTTIINNVYVYNNHNYYSGPDRRSLEKATRNRVSVREVRNNTRPGRSTINSNSLAIYRPNINPENNKNARPRRIVSPDKVTSSSRRINANSDNINNSRPNRGTAPKVESGISTNKRASRRNKEEASGINNTPINTRQNRTTIGTREAAASRPINENPATTERVTRQSRNNTSGVVPNSNQTNQKTRQPRTSGQREAVPLQRTTTTPSRRDIAPSPRTSTPSRKEVTSSSQRRAPARNKANVKRETRPAVTNTRNGNNRDVGNKSATRGSRTVDRL